MTFINGSLNKTDENDQLTEPEPNFAALGFPSLTSSYLFDLGTTVPSYHPRADPRPPPETRFLRVLSGYPWTRFGSALRIFFTATSASRCGRGSRSGARISSLGLRIRSATSASRSSRSDPLRHIRVSIELLGSAAPHPRARSRRRIRVANFFTSWGCDGLWLDGRRAPCSGDPVCGGKCQHLWIAMEPALLPALSPT
jgi:hypothetical protein